MQTRGACPGAYTPMASGDGWLVRVRTGARALTSAELRELSRLAHAYGNGVIELTRRANLQLRGLAFDAVPALRAELIALGLVDASPAREGRPALLVDPVAAVGGNASLTQLAAALDGALAESGLLSPKLGVVLDAGSGSVWRVDADIRVVVTSAERVQIFVATRAGAELLGECSSARVHEAVAALLEALADFAAGSGEEPNVRRRADADARTGAGGRASSSAPRMRDFVAVRGLAALRAACTGLVPAAGAGAFEPPPTAALGFHDADGCSWFGVGLPFGSASHADWSALAELAERFGAAEVRLTPGREVLILGVAHALAGELERAASQLGFITQASDPRQRVVACSGTPACGSAYGETRGLASRLGAQLQPLLAAGATLHVSGCEKGCASRAVADVTVVLAPGGARVAFEADVAAACGTSVEVLELVFARVEGLGR